MGEETTTYEWTAQIPVDRIDRSPYNRKSFDKAKASELLESVRTHGILNDLIVRPIKNGSDRFELIAGERRWQAAKELKLQTVPCKVEERTDLEAMEIQAIENLQREDLSPLDEAQSYQNLIEGYEKEYGGASSREDAIKRITERTGKARSTIYERLSLLKLAKPVQEKVSAGALPASHAALIGKLPPERQAKIVAGIAPEKKVKNWQERDKLDGLLGDNLGVERDEETGLVNFRDVKEVVEEQLQEVEHEKKYNQKAEAYRAKGGRALNWSDSLLGYVDGTTWMSDYAVNVRELVNRLEKKAIRPKVKMIPPDGQLAYVKADLLKALKEAGIKPRANRIRNDGSPTNYAALERRRRERERQGKVVVAKILTPLRAAAGKRNAKIPWFLLFKQWAGYRGATYACKVRGVKTGYSAGNYPTDKIAQVAAKLPENQIPGLVADCLIGQAGDTAVGKDLVELAAFYGVDAKAIVKAETKAEKKPAAKAAAPAKSRRLTANARVKLGKLMKERWNARRKGANK